jgi:hypothetical protein
MPHLPHRLAARPLFVMAALALIAGGCGSDSGSDVIGGGSFPTNTPTPTPLPMATLTPIPALTPVIPAGGGTYKVDVTFVLVEGACGGPTTFQADLNTTFAPWPPLAAGPTPDSQEITFEQILTGNVNKGWIDRNSGLFDASSADESYTGLLVIERDESGNEERIVMTGTNTWTGADGCTNRYNISGEGAVESV